MRYRKSMQRLYLDREFGRFVIVPESLGRLSTVIFSLGVF